MVRAEGESTDFAEIQRSHIQAFRARYAEYAAKRLPRTREPQGRPAGT